MNTLTRPADAKKVFARCGTCSRTFGHLLNRAYGENREIEEKALDPLAGGLLNTGHQCGMLWGSALATGAEAARRFEDPAVATAAAIRATRELIDSFVETTETTDCRDITGCDLTTRIGLAKLMFRTMIRGMNNSPCFKLADAWAPEAIASSSAGLAAINNADSPPGTHSCASEVIKRMGGSREEQLMVAGFAGGLGLSGNACGALAAAVWMKALLWYRAHPEKQIPYLKKKVRAEFMDPFLEETGGKMLCREICGCTFESPQAHTAYLEEGGCEKLTEVLARGNKNGVVGESVLT